MVEKTKKELGITNIPISVEHRDKLNVLAKHNEFIQRVQLHRLIDEAYSKLETK